MTGDLGSRWFLVELHAPRPQGGSGVEGMSRALRVAADRLHAGGSPVEWLLAVKVPETGHALCFFAADDETEVVHACDTAGLPQAPVREVVPLPCGTPPHGLLTVALPWR